MSHRFSRVLLQSYAFYMSTSAFAQPRAVAGGPIAFEVVSIKPSSSSEPNRFGFPTAASIRIAPGGRIDATQATLLDLILRGYDLQNFQVAGGPKWTPSDRFDVVAKSLAGSSGGAQQIREMLRDVLADRFKLRVHTETRELPVYRLVLARTDGKLGTQLRPSTVDCAAVNCTPSFHADVKAGTMTIKLQGESMAALARLLYLPETGRAVLDRSGLAGAFDAELTFAPEPLPGFPRLPAGADGVSLFTALREQLGLKLEPDRGPVDVLVIDSAEHPTEN